MSNNKQSSSIDFFWNQLPEILPFSVDTETAVKLWEAFEQAKAMHKDEQIDSLINGMYKGQEMYFSEHKVKLDDNSTVFCAAIAEHYYNERFGGEDDQQ